jgi:excisionase family DNA binding protein
MLVTDDLKNEEALALLREIRTILGCPPKVWLSPEEAAVYLGISRSRLYRYVGNERIPVHRLPDSNLLRLHIRELDEWLREGSQTVEEISRETMRRLLK